MKTLFEIAIYMKSGNVIRVRCIKFKWSKSEGGVIEQLEWENDPDEPGERICAVRLNEIEGITQKTVRAIN